MKKTKLLMPLTGIAAIGAIAPVVVMTSCNKGDANKVFAGIEAFNGGLYGKDVWLDNTGKTKTSLTLDVEVKATVKADAKAGTIYKHSWDAQKSADGLFNVEKQDAEEVTALKELVAGKTYYGTIAGKISVKSGVEIKEDKTFEFKVKYEAYETTTNGEKLVGTQDVVYKLTLSKDKASLPTVSFKTAKQLTGTVATQVKEVVFGGWQTSAAAQTGATISVAYAADADLEVEGTDQSSNKSTLTMNKTANCTLNGTDLAFKGAIAYQTTRPGDTTYTLTEDSIVLLTLTVTGTHTYVASSWTQLLKIESGTKIAVTITA